MRSPYAPAGRTRRARLPWLLALAFVVMPILEIYVLIQVGQQIGVGWTFLLVVAAAVVGGWLVKREGSRAFQALRDALASGRMPAKELADGALVLIGGTLMITPGFVSDVLGTLLVLPVTRPLFRRLLARLVASKLTVVGPGTFATGGFPGAGFAGRGDDPRGTKRRPGPGDVVPGEVVDPDDRTPRAG